MGISLEAYQQQRIENKRNPSNLTMARIGHIWLPVKNFPILYPHKNTSKSKLLRRASILKVLFDCNWVNLCEFQTEIFRDAMHSHSAICSKYWSIRSIGHSGNKCWPRGEQTISKVHNTHKFFKFKIIKKKNAVKN